MKIGNTEIGGEVYFIADIGANHDGDLEKAKALICACAEAGADAAKFQNFTAATIVSEHGFKGLKVGHQDKWGKSVVEVYEDASMPDDWTPVIKETCDKAGVHYLTSPYSPDLVRLVAPYVDAWKLGSGDITWPEVITAMCEQGKPLIISTGASTLDEVRVAYETARKYKGSIALLQCNTNYTAHWAETRSESFERYGCINLKVLETYAREFPDAVLGLSDHTIGHTTVLGAVALGAKIIEKHFTLDHAGEGPDHSFSMEPWVWRDMVHTVKELTASMGDGVKRVEPNEVETVVIQRRALCATRALKAGTILKSSDIFPLRPCPEDALPPDAQAIGKKLLHNKAEGQYFTGGDFAENYIS